ncbi:MAG: hypothetical protein ABW069_10980 [Duganella sp.]
MLNRHVLYLSNEQLTAWRWERGHLAGGAVFTSDNAGIDAFIDYLDSHGRMPAYLLADLIEEDFQRLHVPHVNGPARAKLMQRRLLQQYRETPFRHHEVQGREPDGRRDDIVLLSALTNPSVVQPWVEALEQLRLPLAGLYSTTLLSEDLVRKLALRDEHLLLVTQQSAGWRQSYFQRGQLKFSRLTPAIDRDGDAVDVGTETAKTQQFLTSVRLVARGSMLETVVIAPGDQLDDLAAQCVDGPEIAFQFLPLAQVADRLGLKAPADAASTFAQGASRQADALLLGLLARTRPPSHYTLGPLQRYFQLWRARRNLYVAAATVAGVSALGVGVNLWQGAADRADTARLNAEARDFDQRYNAVMTAMPPRVTTTANMRAAINVERMLQAQGPSPWQLVAMVSGALEQSPQIHLLQLNWKVDLPGQPPASAPVLANGNSGAATATPMSSLLAGIPARPPQTLLLEAEILTAEDDYRNAVNTMNEFAQQLAAHPNLVVQVDKPPLDTRSTVRLNGKAGPQPQDTRARFSLNLVWKP